MEFQENTPLTFVLTVAETNVVLTHLSKGTFDVVSPVIGKIREQAMSQGTEAVPQPREQTEAPAEGESYGGDD